MLQFCHWLSHACARAHTHHVTRYTKMYGKDKQVKPLHHESGTVHRNIKASFSLTHHPRDLYQRESNLK